jgi:hypothetical protein
MRHLVVFLAVFLTFNEYLFSQIPKRIPGKIEQIPDGNGSSVECPITDFQNVKTIPGVTEDPRSISRDQDSVGWCRNFAFADVVCTELQQKMNKPIPKCSASDLSIGPARSYQDINKNSENPLSNLLGKDQDSFESKIRAIRAQGVCSENDFPSEYFNNNSSLYGDAVKKFATAITQNNMTEAKVGLDGFCKECTKDIQDEAQLKKLKEDLERAAISSDRRIDIAMLKEVNKFACKNRYGQGVPLEVKEKTGRKGFGEVNQVIATGKPVMVEYDIWNFLSDDVREKRIRKTLGPIDSMHTSVIVQGRKIGNKCFFIIKNAFGNDCSAYKKGLPYLMCSEPSGLIAVESKVLIESKFTWVE